MLRFSQLLKLGQYLSVYPFLFQRYRFKLFGERSYTPFIHQKLQSESFSILRARGCTLINLSAVLVYFFLYTHRYIPPSSLPTFLNAPMALSRCEISCAAET